MNANYVINNVKIAMVKNADDNRVSRVGVFRNTREVMYLIDVNTNRATYITDDLLTEIIELGIPEFELWKIALENTKRDTKIESLESMITGMSSLVTEFEEGGMYAVTNANYYLGASSILDTELLQKMAKANGIKKLFVIPCSIHEVIVVPYTEMYKTDMINTIINEVNENEVEEKDRLADHVAIIEL